MLILLLTDIYVVHFKALQDSQSDRAATPTNAPGGNSAEYT